MKFGVNILNFGPGTVPATLLQQAVDARELGYSFAMISDHVAVTADVQEAYPAPFYDQFVLASHIAGRVPGLTLGTTVTVIPYRHPLHTARLAANIDCLNADGFILGAGVGWSRAEYAALGVPFAERGRITDEYLTAIRAAWSEDPTTFRGEYVSYEGVRTAPAPATAPRLPVWVGGNSATALGRAARLGEGWHPYLATLSAMRAALPVLAEQAERAERPTPALVPRLQVRITEARLDGEHPVGHGTVDQIREDLTALAELGATHLLLDTNPDSPGLRGTAADDRRLLELLTEKVLDPATGTIR
ncbi:TIGR03619 family F420-dependent LLM class oxidoreductase [Streptomyces sp. NBC_01387]|uniref:TIGR03619 family F420-dependent LLM class oxidoreductase n=1 Tax=unclassified Streptomyces TaxID=2593676 RepID=UPI00224D1141|nr:MULTISPECIES: TIGR03619 family F420-dependent LLM class oxidoreductase [unclassified Streptomyces]MCX4552883.1 TIGR03619 family F420-dependent LLM class oxidoreductase [Streptomyces sp. NBC_01500]WSV58099.1 TIGR03619 family F420-dependent LLM class oxidoreductase [Streptomyces sp. NBC_01014]